MMYDSLDKEQDKQFLSFWIVFCLFLHPMPPPHPNNSENQNFDVRFLNWDTEYNRQSFLSFWTIFCSFTPPPLGPNNPKNQIKKFQKMKKTSGNIIILHIHIDDMMNSSWDMVHNGWMGRQTDWRSEKVMYRGGCLC